MRMLLFGRDCNVEKIRSVVLTEQSENLSMHYEYDREALNDRNSMTVNSAGGKKTDSVDSALNSSLGKPLNA